MRHPLLVEGRPNCARQSLASTVSAPHVAETSCCDPGRHANVITPCLLTPCLNVPYCSCLSCLLRFRRFRGFRNFRRFRERRPACNFRSGKTDPVHCLATIFDSQLPSPKLSPKMPPKLSLAHKRGHFSSFKITPAVRAIAR